MPSHDVSLEPGGVYGITNFALASLNEVLVAYKTVKANKSIEYEIIATGDNSGFYSCSVFVFPFRLR